MTQTCSIPHRPHLRDHAEKLLAAFDAAPSPQTYSDILRAARTLMALDRLITQLWSEPGRKTSGRRSETASVPETLTETITETMTGADEAIAVPPPPLNRQQRRAQAARERGVRPMPAATHCETG